MTKFVFAVLIILLGCSLTIGLSTSPSRRAPAVVAAPIPDILSDYEVRERIVLLYAEGGLCTGIQVISPKRRVYVLTAAHCSEFMVGGYTRSRSDDGTENILQIVDINLDYDLLLLSAPYRAGLTVAKDARLHDLVHTVTHGRGFPLWRADGEIIAMSECDAEMTHMFSGDETCKEAKPWYVTTAKVLPGSSGGPLLNTRNELVGVVSAVDGYGFSCCITLPTIKDFLRAK